MAEDAAAFFAKKKQGKKKAFKFNANNIDAGSVIHTQHIDAPALSTDQETGMASLSLNSNANNADTLVATVDKTAGEQWDDEALAATLSRKKNIAPGGAVTTELLDMKALGPKRNEQENIAERLRVEENKARLAAAKEGMEREAQRIKEEQEKKKEAETSATAARFGSAAAAAGGSKWIPPHMRAGGAGLSRVKMGAAPGGKVDTQDENLFPDLAAADAIIEQQQKQLQPAFKVVKKTPVGGGATWGGRPKDPAKQEPKKEDEPEPAPEPTPASPPKAEAPTTEELAPAATPSATKPLLNKRKKKDLSTFKPS